MQQVEFLWSEAQLPACLLDPARLEVNPESAAVQHRWIRFRGRGKAPHRGPDPGEQFRYAKGLADVVVRPGIQCLALVLLAVSDGHDDNRGVRGGADLATSLQAADPGEVHVEQYSIRSLVSEGVKSFFSSLCSSYLVTLCD